MELSYMSFRPKILLIRQLALGDVLLITPILKQIYVDHAGDCEIDVMTMKPEAFVNNPYVNEIISPTQHLENRKNYHKTINLDLAYESHPGMHILDAYAKYSYGSIEKILDKQKRNWSQFLFCLPCEYDPSHLTMLV
jgi:hypothetical protein